MKRTVLTGACAIVVVALAVGCNDALPIQPVHRSVRPLCVEGCHSPTTVTAVVDTLWVKSTHTNFSGDFWLVTNLADTAVTLVTSDGAPDDAVTTNGDNTAYPQPLSLDAEASDSIGGAFDVVELGTALIFNSAGTSSASIVVIVTTTCPARAPYQTTLCN